MKFKVKVGNTFELSFEDKKEADGFVDKAIKLFRSIVVTLMVIAGFDNRNDFYGSLSNLLNIIFYD